MSENLNSVSHSVSQKSPNVSGNFHNVSDSFVNTSTVSDEKRDEEIERAITIKTIKEASGRWITRLFSRNPKIKSKHRRWPVHKNLGRHIGNCPYATNGRPDTSV